MADIKNNGPLNAKIVFSASHPSGRDIEVEADLGRILAPGDWQFTDAESNKKIIVAAHKKLGEFIEQYG